MRIKLKLGVETEGVAYGELEMDVPDKFADDEEALDTYLWMLDYEKVLGFEDISWNFERAYPTGKTSSIDGWEVV